MAESKSKREPVYEATLAERGQVVIPKALRDRLGLVPGTQLSFSVEGGRLIVRKKVDDAFSRARGMFKLAEGESVRDFLRATRGHGHPAEGVSRLAESATPPARAGRSPSRRR